jgi:large subunit ribosomal protein L28
MSAVCEICGKKTKIGGSIVYSGLPKKTGGIGLNRRKTNKRAFKPNLQKVRAFVNGEVKRMKVCTTCIKSNKVIKPPVRSKA